MITIGRTGSTLGTIAAAAAILAVGAAGGAVAGGMVSSAQIKNNTIQSVDVHNNSLKGIDIKDGSIGAADLGAGSVKSAKLGKIVVRSTQKSVATGQGAFAQVSCNPGETLIGGGTTTSGVGLDPHWTVIRSSRAAGNSWDAAIWNATGVTGELFVEAYCLQ